MLNTIHPKWVIEEYAISIFKDVNFICLKVPIKRDIEQITPVNRFIENLEKKARGTTFCQVNRVAITNHEIILDILINQKCNGPIAIFKEIKIVIM